MVRFIISKKIDLFQYAKFLTEEHALNFSFNVADQVKGNQLNHFGIQLEGTEEVLTQKKRLEDAGFLTKKEMNTQCCYALQDKFWVQDPDGNGWEFFFSKGDSEAYTKQESTTCCVN